MSNLSMGSSAYAAVAGSSGYAPVKTTAAAGLPAASPGDAGQNRRDGQEV